MKLSEIYPNPDNPREITAEALEKLKKSISEFEKMMSLRPIVVDENNMILGGNMRYYALLELGYDEIQDDWVKRADDLTDEEKRRFIIADNVIFGTWDFDVLANEWDEKLLSDFDIIDFETSGTDEKTKDISDELQPKFIVEVEVESEAEQEKLYNELTKNGYTCRIFTL